MKAVYKVFLVLAIIAAGYTNLHADERIKIRIKQPPPNMLGVGDMWNLTLENTTKTDLKIYLTGTATEEKDGLIIEGKSKVFTIKPGKTNYKYSDFSGAEVKYNNGKYKEIILRTGNAPEGSYSICVNAFEEGGESAGIENCITQTVQQMGSITLISPENKAELDPDTLPGLMFSWTPLLKGGPYLLRIVELKGNESPENAIKENRPILDKEGITATNYQYSLSDPKLEAGKNYAWQVSSGDVVSEIGIFGGKEDRDWDIDIQNENGWLELADTIYYKPRPGHRHWWSGRRWDTLIVNNPSDESVDEHKPRPGHRHWWSGKRWDTLVVHTEIDDENPEAILVGGVGIH